MKRLIGRKFSDASIQRDAKLFPFKSKCLIHFVHIPKLRFQLNFALTFLPLVIAGTSDKPMVEVQAGTERKSFAPEEVSAMVRILN